MAVRSAVTADVPLIAALINDYAEQGLMLHRSHADLYDNIRDYVVAVERDEEADSAGRVLGVCGLRVLWANLAEIYALAVAGHATRRGVGKQLIAAIVGEAERLGIRRLFALTYEQRFFESNGFEVVNRHTHLPLKVWTECIRCPKNQNCDEIAVMRVLEGVPDLAPAPNPPAPSVYELPVLSEPIKEIEKEAT